MSNYLLFLFILVVSSLYNGIIVTNSFSIGNNGGGKNRYFNNNNNNNDNNPDNDGYNPILPLLATTAVISAPKKSLLLASTTTKNPKQSPFSIFTKLFQKEESEEVTPPLITSVTIQNSTLLPPNIISYARTRSNIIGSSDPVSSIQSFSKYIREWYTRHGYILNSVKGVHVTSDGECIVSVQEYKTSQDTPLEFITVKPMIWDNVTDSYLTLKQYRNKQLEKSPSQSTSKTKYTKREDFPNVTYILPQDGSTSIKASNKWYKALKLQPGSDFVWDETHWKHKYARHFSSLLRTVLQVQPKLLEDGSVSLQLIVEEHPMKSLEYGVTRSLYTGSWEGEINFQHNNVFGSGEKLGVVIQRSPSTNLEKEPSWNVYYRDDKLGCGNAYSIGLFNDFVSQDKPEEKEGPLIRRGTTFQLYPLNNYVSYVKLNMERICMNKGTSNENILSSQYEIGPFRRQAKILQSVSTNLNTGVRFKELPLLKSSTPFSAITFKLQHIIPFKGIRLAFQQKISGYSDKLPIHEQNALFLSSPIRGVTINCKDFATTKSDVNTLVSGINEIRFPTWNIPIKEYNLDLNCLLFHDWLVSGMNDKLYKQSFGIGLRKVVQGIPIKYDVCWDVEGGVIKNVFGIGRDFDL